MQLPRPSGVLCRSCRIFDVFTAHTDRQLLGEGSGQAFRRVVVQMHVLILDFYSLISSHRFEFPYGRFIVQLILQYEFNSDDRLPAVVEVHVQLVIVLNEMINHRIFFSRPLAVLARRGCELRNLHLLVQFPKVAQPRFAAVS